MKVIAFKIYQRQLKILRNMVDLGFYSSLSEAIRMSAFDFSVLLNSLKNEEEKPDSESFQETMNRLRLSMESGYARSDSKKVSTSCKFPTQLLTHIDDFVRHDVASNRSEFLRIALTRFIRDDASFYASVPGFLEP